MTIHILSLIHIFFDVTQGVGGTIEWTYFLGAAVAAISGYAAIRIFLKLLEKKSMRYFSFYVWIVAVSYTHLDVYKRQLQTRASRVWILPFLLAVVLVKLMALLQ